MSNTPLDQSIRHWKYIATGMAGSQGSKNCDLCIAHRLSGLCFTCPVYRVTKQYYCRDTPYKRFIKVATLEDHTYEGYTARTPAAKKLAWDMVRFLQSLKD